MDRFEVAELNEEPVPNWIYIPVWIDLKSSPAILYPTNYTLHSSMDRFEASAVNCFLQFFDCFTFQYG